MTSIVRCPTYSTSSAVVKRWRLKRIDECASSAEAPSAAMTYEGSSVDAVQADPEASAQLRQPLALGAHLGLRELRRLAEAHDQGNRQRAGAHTTLMTAAVDHRRDPHAWPLAPHVERADTLGAVQEVRGARQEVDAHRLYVDGDLAEGLGGVGVKDDSL